MAAWVDTGQNNERPVDRGMCCFQGWDVSTLKSSLLIFVPLTYYNLTSIDLDPPTPIMAESLQGRRPVPPVAQRLVHNMEWTRWDINGR